MTSPSTKLTVVIVNWNAGDQLMACIRSLQSEFPAIVIDNGSTDGSCNSIEQLENVTLIAVGQNLGFAKACNLGAKHANSEYVLFLNPDAAVFPNTISHSLQAMDAREHAQVGICGVQLANARGKIERSCARFPTPGRLVAQSLGLDRLFKRLSHLMIEWPHNSIRQVDQVMGAYFLVRKAIFDKLGGFDERFFLYFEEVDLSYRARQSGWKSLYLADAQAFHKGGGTSNQIKARRLFYIMRSRILYADKHFSRPGSWTVIASTFLLEPLSRSALTLSRRSWSELKETWQGYAMLWQWFRLWVSKGITR